MTNVMHISPVAADLFHADRQTDRRTDRQIDRQTEGRTDRHDESNSRFSQFCKSSPNLDSGQ